MTIAAATTMSGFAGFLNREQAQPIFDRAARMSVAQRLAKQIPLGGNGVSVPVTTGKLTAGWVAEGAMKPKSAGTMALKNMDPKKLSVIAVVSAEVVRANPGGYMTNIKDQVAAAFAQGFDLAAFHDYAPDGTAGGGPFSTWLDQTTKAVELGTTTQANGGIHGDLVAGLALLVNDGKKMTGFALDDRIEPTLLGAVDTNGRPIYAQSELPVDETSEAIARPGILLNRRSYMSEGVYGSTADDTFAYGGDWTQAAWGVVGGIAYKVSTEASVTINGTLVSLFENNLVAVLAEAEYGWVVNDTAAFVKYVNAV